MKKKLLIGSLLTILILSMIGVSVYREVYAQGPAVKVLKVKEGDISSYLMVPGTITLEEQQAVYASPERGTLKDIMVEEGQSIKKGTVIAKFENAQLQLEREQNALSLESNSMKISQLENQISDLEDQEVAVSVGDLPDSAAAAQIAAQISQLEMELKVAELELKQANLQKESIAKRIADLEIKSTIDGIVLLVNENASSSMGSAEPAVIIGKMEGLVAKGLLSEYDTLKVSMGQKVILRSDAVPDKEWPGEVSKVSTLPETQGASLNGTQAVQYPVFVKLSGTNPVLKPGFQVIMDIETEKKTGIVLPDSAIVDEGDSHYVFVVEKGIAHKQKVETGIISGPKVEIIKGLKKNQKVAANPSDKLEDGMEVTAK